MLHTDQGPLQVGVTSFGPTGELRMFSDSVVSTLLLLSADYLNT